MSGFQTKWKLGLRWSLELKCFSRLENSSHPAVSGELNSVFHNLRMDSNCKKTRIFM